MVLGGRATLWHVALSLPPAFVGRGMARWQRAHVCKERRAAWQAAAMPAPGARPSSPVPGVPTPSTRPVPDPPTPSAAPPQVLATHLSEKAVDIADVDWTRPTAFVLGNEKEGGCRGLLGWRVGWEQCRKGGRGSAGRAARRVGRGRGGGGVQAWGARDGIHSYSFCFARAPASAAALRPLKEPALG